MISIASPAIGEDLRNHTCPTEWSGVMRQLFDVLKMKNGFFAFESALLIRPVGNGAHPLPVGKWNQKPLWLETYRFDLPELYFFAEDAFGGQFAISEGAIVSFDPETGEIEEISDSLDGWATEVMSDYDYFTGHSLCSEWQRINGSLPVAHRLVPRQLDAK